MLKLGNWSIIAFNTQSGPIDAININETGGGTAVLQAQDSDLPALQFTVDNTKHEIKLTTKPWLLKKFTNQSITLTINAPVKNLQLTATAPVNYPAATIANFDLKVLGAVQGKLSFANLTKLNANVSGASNVTFEGVSDQVNYTINGSGTYNAQGLVANKFAATINGSGKLTQTIAPGGNLVLDIHGAGKTTFFGNAEKADYTVTGSGEIHAYEMETKDVKVTFTGSSLLEQRFPATGAGSKLGGSITGSSTIYYINLPDQQTLTITGSAKLLPKN
jgi:hypothetical protein